MAAERIDKFIKMMHEHMNIPEQAGDKKLLLESVNKVIAPFTWGVCKCSTRSW